MSDRMTPVPFGTLISWIQKERKEQGSIFAVCKPYLAGDDAGILFGPAAGPHTQLAQNIASAYYAGARFFELKTVQILDGEELPVSKPCIKTGQEAYNVEWSTELYVAQAFEEYVKAWFLLFFLAKEYALGDIKGFRFNMSVGYDLAGIKSKKIDDFLEGMKDASETPVFKECQAWLLAHVQQFERITAEDIADISPFICNSVTLSTLHGCPQAEIERIASYLITEKKLHTFIKLNPTLLGYENARRLMDELGYDTVFFGRLHFEEDLQLEAAVPMLQRLQRLAGECSMEFGVKLTNTFPVDIRQKELPGEEMYMSGNPLYAVSLSAAQLIAEAFAGQIRISYSGGADAFHLENLLKAGIYPVTMATTLLKPGGYQRFTQMAQMVSDSRIVVPGSVNIEGIIAEIEQAKQDRYCIRMAQLPGKSDKALPLTDCFMAPCEEGCPIGQDICGYMEAAAQGDWEKAFSLIIEKNPMPFTTGTICPHTCMNRCTRNYYEQSVHIRNVKLEAAQQAFSSYNKQIVPTVKKHTQVAIIGAGPAGMSAAYFLAREGIEVKVFEKENSPGGIVRHVIPDFRITENTVKQDMELIGSMGITVQTDTEIADITSLREEYDAVILAIGAGKTGSLKLEEGDTINAISFLREYKLSAGTVRGLGKQVAVIGGGNTAMDTARAAKRVPGVESVCIIYRRTEKDMPADREEIEEARREGIAVKELCSPVCLKNGSLRLTHMQVCGIASDGRNAVETSGEWEDIPIDTVIAATGERIDKEFYSRNKIAVTDSGSPVTTAETLETSVEKVYAVGDGCRGPQTVVKAIRDARIAADAILDRLSMQNRADSSIEGTKDAIATLASALDARGVLLPEKVKEDCSRCLGCRNICQLCVEVCPNRANISVTASDGTRQIIHLDALCNECGNCMNFCPYQGAPYLDKFTCFAGQKEWEESRNQGFCLIDKATKTCLLRLGGDITKAVLSKGRGILPESLYSAVLVLIDSMESIISTKQQKKGL